MCLVFQRAFLGLRKGNARGGKGTSLQVCRRKRIYDMTATTGFFSSISDMAHSVASQVLLASQTCHLSLFARLSLVTFSISPSIQARLLFPSSAASPPLRSPS